MTLFFPLAGYSSDLVSTMTLDQCLETGIKNNPSLKAARFSLDAAEHNIKAARADFFPSLSSNYSITILSSDTAEGPTETDYLDQDIRTFNIKLTQILYSGSRIFNTYKKYKIQKQLVRAEMNLERLELIYNIKARFYQFMKAKQDTIMITESVNRLSESLKAARSYFKKELIPYVDVLQAKVDLEDTKSQLGIAKNNINRERVALFSLMNIEHGADIKFLNGNYNTFKSTHAPDFTLCYKQAIEHRPDIKRLEYQFEIINKEKKIAMGKYLPVLRFDVGYYGRDKDYEEYGSTITGSYDRDQKNNYWSTGISATWAMFDGGKSWYEKKKFNSEALKIKALISQSKNMIATGIHKALFSMAEAKQRIISSEDTIKAAHEYYAREENRLKAALSTFPTLLDAQDRLTRAKANKTQAVLDYYLARSELDFMTGQEK